MTRFLPVLLAALVLVACAPTAAQARPRMRSVMQDDCLLVGLSRERQCFTSNRGAALDAMKSLGADTIRVTIVRDKTRSGWASFDAAVAETLAHGLDPLVTLTDRGRTPTPKQFGNFVGRAVRRYAGVHIWSLYNEPNLLYWLRSRSARDYRNLVVAGEEAIRKVNGHRRDTILIGELAPHVSANGGTAVGPLRFTRELFCLDPRLRPLRGREGRRLGCQHFKRFTADGFAVHPYTKGALRPPVGKDVGDGYSVTTLGRITQIIDAAARRGRTNRMSIWDTEMGFQSKPPVPHGPSLAQQAEYINWGDWIQYRNPRVASVSQYLLQDGRYHRGGFTTGLRTVRGKRKPSYDAYRLGIFPTSAGGGFVRVWAQARPGRAHTVAFQRQAHGHGPFRTVGSRRTNGSGYVEPRFRGAANDRWRVRWSGLSSRTASVR